MPATFTDIVFVPPFFLFLSSLLENEKDAQKIRNVGKFIGLFTILVWVLLGLAIILNLEAIVLGIRACYYIFCQDAKLGACATKWGDLIQAHTTLDHLPSIELKWEL